VAEKERNRAFTYLWAFVLGVVLMVGVYGLFQATGNRNRAGLTGTTDAGSANLALTAGNSPVARGVAGTDATDSPSAFLGVEILSIGKVFTDQLNLPSGGVLINDVVPDSPAETAGLARGDAIVRLNKSPVENVQDFREVMLELAPGDRIRIVYVRDGEKDSVYTVLASAPAATSQSPVTGDSEWGISLSPLTSALRSSLAVPDDVTGVAIMSVVPGSLADEADLSPGDVIVGIDKTPVSNMSEFFSALAGDSDSTALLDVYSQGRMRYVPVDSPPAVSLTGGPPFSTDDDDEEEGPKGGKFAQDDVQLTSENVAFNRPETVPGDVNTGGSSPSSTTGMNRPSSVPPQSSGSTNDVVLFVGILLLAVVYLAYREYHRPPEVDGSK